MVLETERSVFASCLAWVNSTHSAIRPVEAEVQAWGATAICVIGAREKVGKRPNDAWTNDLPTLRERSNVLHPWEDTVKIDCVFSGPVADLIEGGCGQSVQ